MDNHSIAETFRAFADFIDSGLMIPTQFDLSHEVDVEYIQIDHFTSLPGMITADWTMTYRFRQTGPITLLDDRQRALGDGG